MESTSISLGRAAAGPGWPRYPSEQALPRRGGNTLITFEYTFFTDFVASETSEADIQPARSKKPES